MQDITQAEAIHWLATQQKSHFNRCGYLDSLRCARLSFLKRCLSRNPATGILIEPDLLKTEPEKFYQFVKTLYHPDAQPNIIHQKMAQLEQMKRGKIVSQNIDGLHRKQVAKKWWTFMVIYMNVIAKLVVQRFLGKTICLVIGTLIVMDKSVQLLLCMKKDYPKRQLKAIQAVASADLIVIVGTSFQAHPFCDLIHYKQPTATILAINQTPLFYNNLIIFRSESRNDICRINDKGVTEWKNLNQKKK